MRKLVVFSAVTLTCFSTMVTAAQADWQHCDLSGDADFLPYSETSEDSEVDVKADNAQLVEDGTSVFTGNVEVNRAGQQLKASRATYDQNSGDISAQGNVVVRDSDIILNADQGEWSLADDEGTMIDAEYRLREMHARGEASVVHRQGTTQTKLKNATYTTCAAGDDAWLLQASNVDLNHEKAVGTAKNVVVRLGRIPILYTPYMSFPLNDERKSGFLTPAIGNSNETGFDVSTPYYWNISPNMDATFTPRYMSDRGLMLNGEFRYLHQKGEGTLDAAFLGSDSLKKDGDDVNPYYHDDRKHFSWKNRTRLSSRWATNLDYNYVSDDEYLEDFGSNLSIASTTHLNRKLDLNYSGDNWNFVARAQGYQTLTDVSKPYQRLPQFKLTGSLPDQAMGMTYGLTTEYVDFDHDDDVAGQRVNIEPSVSLPWRSAAAFITPRVALSHTRYDLDKNVTTNIDKTPTRTLPITSLDSGLFFERELSFGNSGYIQTLEPRAFYLYVPHRDQDDIPDFDTSLRTFNMGQLFSYDRFSGVDRVGDANQLSLAITSRLIDQETGRENLRVSLGQIRYFRDRKVSLGTTYNPTRSDSDMVAEVAASLAKEWTLRGEIQWNPHGDTSNMSAVTLRYRGDNGSLLNVSHRYRRDNISALDGLEQVDISARLPLNKQWSMVGRWYRSLKDTTTLEVLGGIEYESCCWATRLVVRDYVNDVTDDERNLAVFFQIELKGLGNFGQKTEKLLERSILGYGI
ncbi:organic solvent tolerance protein [Methylophaga sp. 42_8_T64]|nr:organic solvent tolerance protein [Methylophaga sp. 42_8_T64]